MSAPNVKDTDSSESSFRTSLPGVSQPNAGSNEITETDQSNSSKAEVVHELAVKSSRQNDD